MKTKLHYVLSIVMLLFCFYGFGQKSLFTKVESNTNDSKTISTSQVNDKGLVYSYDYHLISRVLSDAPERGGVNSKSSDLIIEFPTLNGKTESYRIEEASVMAPELQAKYPEIRSYVGYGIDTPSSYLRFSLSPYNGLNGIVLSGDINKTIMINSLRDDVSKMVISKKSSLNDKGFSCATIDANPELNELAKSQMSANNVLHTFDLAMSVSGEYSQFHGGTLPQVNAAIVTTLTRVNGIYETDFNVVLVLIATNDSVVYLDPASDPYDGASDANYNFDLASTLDLNIGSANYDVGHLMAGIGNNGNAGCIGCVCVNGSVATDNHKGSGYTTSTEPIGDNFDVDYVAHELGHQFGANHTFTFSSEGGIAQMEPGSGSTIMGYAGITGATDLQPHSDPYFHAISIQQVTSHVASRTCDVETVLSNNVPSVNAGSNLTLPIGTPFKLTGSATDADSGDVLTYCWEQFDENNGANAYPNPTSTNSNEPLFRSYLPSTNPSRMFPLMEDLVAYGVNGSTWEKIPTVARTADFRLTVRDNKPGGGANSYDDMVVTWDATKGPLQVTSHATTNLTLFGGSTDTVTWDVNSTDTMSGASNVDILLSIDNGVTYSTIIASNVPNNGSYTYTVPSTPAPYCRLMIQPTGAPFFAVNTENFSINYQVTPTCIQYSSSPNAAIADNSQSFSVVDAVNITDSYTITDVNVGVDITHTYIGDLAIGVQSPSGTFNLLMAPDDCGNIDDLLVVYDDQGSVFDCNNSATNQSYQPTQSPLSNFIGEGTAGQWLFGVGDYYTGDIGTLNSWYVEVCYNIETPLSTDEFALENFSIFPNPNNGSFTVKLHSSSGEEVDISVFDIRGRSIFSKSFDNNIDFNQQINLTNVQSGMYMVKVSDGLRTTTQKIIVN